VKLEPAGYSASINFDQLNAIAATRQGRQKPPRDGALPRSLALALAAHAVLALMLIIGTAWTTSPPAAIEAELWAPLPREAAPKPPPPPAQEQPVVKPEPAPPPPKAQEDRDAEIAIEKKKKEEQQRKEAAEEKKLEEQKKREEAQAKKDAEKKAQADKAKAAAEAEKRQQEFTRQLMAQAGTGAPTATGTAAQAASPRGDASYAAKVVAAVRSNTVFDEATVASNNPAVFNVTLLPDGTPGGVQLSKSSGDAAFDSAVERGIRKTNPFPRPDSGVYPRSLEIVYRPRK
jgi:colicin import membrane protein